MKLSKLIDADCLLLMRIPFSLFLMPIYWFAISQTNPVVWSPAILCFVVLHLFIYPASNGYNSYMDRDEGSIGGLRNPPKVTLLLFYYSIVFDVVGLLIALFINLPFFCFVGLYLLASRAYSYKGIRLKKYPILGYLVVIFFQGAFTYLMVKTAVNPENIDLHFMYQGKAMLACSLLIGGVYPLTQIYQHKEDAQNGDNTISLLVGVRGTFVLSALLFGIANFVLYLYFGEAEKLSMFLLFQLCLFPVVGYFLWWAFKTWKDGEQANFDNTMRMNTIASIAMSVCFILMTIMSYFK